MNCFYVLLYAGSYWDCIFRNRKIIRSICRQILCFVVYQIRTSRHHALNGYGVLVFGHATSKSFWPSATRGKGQPLLIGCTSCSGNGEDWAIIVILHSYNNTVTLFLHSYSGSVSHDTQHCNGVGK